METQENQQRTKTSSKARPSSSTALANTMTAEDKTRLGIMLGQLGSHFWRPDFTPAQVSHLIKDYAGDLASCTIPEIEVAIRDYRLQPKIPGKMKPFPG